MGADLITVGYTRDETFPLVPGTVKAFVDAIPDDELLAHKDLLDSAGRLDLEDEDADDASIIRGWLLAGVDELIYAEHGRYTNSWAIPGTSLRFYVAGATSWGDGPFEGYDELCILLDAHTVIPELAEYTGVCLFDGYSIPSLEQMKDHGAERCGQCEGVIRLLGTVVMREGGHRDWCPTQRRG